MPSMVKAQGGTFIVHYVQLCFGLDRVGHHGPHLTRDSAALY